jgi:hypothetical protein
MTLQYNAGSYIVNRHNLLTASPKAKTEISKFDNIGGVLAD